MTLRALSVRRVDRDRRSSSFFVSLREDEAPRRQFDILVGMAEGTMIKVLTEGETTPRPLTHDLFVTALEKVGADVVRTVLTKVVDGTYFAEVVIDGPEGEITLSCRPSDGIALALRAHAPVFALEDLLNEVGTAAADLAPESTEIIDEFRDFIENIRPEDFDL